MPREETPPAPLPFPDSLCHRCAAPPRYIQAARSVFIFCPRLPQRYPPQPVRACHLFEPKAAPPAGKME
jgi:hypothetical protein